MPKQKIPFLQNVANLLYRHPKGYILKIHRHGGWLNYQSIERAHKQMKKASHSILVSDNGHTESQLEVHFLTGKKYWHQTIFCIKSLQDVCSFSIKYHIYDDGSFDEQMLRQIKKQVPSSVIHSLEEIEARLKAHLPSASFLYLWEKRSKYIHIRKLTDIHVGTTGWKLVLDSDMLFWSTPCLMIDWLKKPSCPFFILDIQNSYGYSKGLMESISQNRIRDRLNVGAIGIQSESISWAEVAKWSEELEKNEGTSYYLEQALTAMLLGDQEATIGPEKDYIVFPSKEDVLNKNGILHHYVDLSKEWYFKTAWKQFI